MSTKQLPKVKSLAMLRTLCSMTKPGQLGNRYARLACLTASDLGNEKAKDNVSAALEHLATVAAETSEKDALAQVNGHRDLEWQEAKEAAEVVGLDAMADSGTTNAEAMGQAPAKPAPKARKAKAAPKGKAKPARKASAASNRAKRYTEADMRKFVALLKKKSLAAIKREFGISRHTLRKFRDAK